MAHHGESRIYYIDSRLRVDGTDTDFTINLNLPRNNFDRIALLQFSCPKSFYNFRVGRNVFYLIEDGVEVPITVPIGNYSLSTLLHQFPILLNNASPNGWTYTITYPRAPQVDTGKLTFKVSGNGGLQPAFRFENFCYIQLGFTINSTNIFGGDTLTSANYINLSPVNRLFIKSEMCDTSEGGILQEVLETFCDSAYIYYENTNIDNNAKIFNDNSSRTFRFTITDTIGVPLDTNGLPVIFSIILFKKDDTSVLHKEELLINNLERLLKLSQLELMDKNLLSGDTHHFKHYNQAGIIQEDNLIARPSNFEQLFPGLPETVPEDTIYQAR